MYLRQDPGKGVIWWSKDPKMTLTVGSIITKVYMDTQTPGAINQCEAVTYIYVSHDTCVRSRIYAGWSVITIFW